MHDALTLPNQRTVCGCQKMQPTLTFGTNGFYLLPLEDYTPSADITFDEDWVDTGGWTTSGQGSFTTSSNNSVCQQLRLRVIIKGPEIKYRHLIHIPPQTLTSLWKTEAVGNTGSDLHQSYWYLYDEDDNIIAGFGLFDSHADSSSNNNLYRYNGSTGSTLASQTNLTVSGDWCIQRTGNQLTLTMNGYTTVTETANNTKAPAAYVKIFAKEVWQLRCANTDFWSDCNRLARSVVDNDQSGQGNHFEAHNVDGHHALPDIPTNNWCTITLFAGAGMTLSEGNLKVATTTNNRGRYGTFGVSSGKWYYECIQTTQLAAVFS